MDEGALGKGPAAKEFPSITPEDLEEIYNLFLKLFHKYGRYIDNIVVFKKYTGIDDPLGGGDEDTWFYNSRVTLYQFLYALAMTRHPLVKEMSISEFDISKFDEEILVQNQIMAGMKILDLGSGPEPTFARYCRAMGADVWTVDRIPAGQLRFKPEFFSREQRGTEVSRHIQVDLSNGLASRVIKEKSGGEFNLATEAQLHAAGFDEARNIAWVLLKRGGIYNGHGVSINSRPEVKE